MGWQDFLMRHGIGSPGYIAKTMARQYRAIKEANPSLNERSVLLRLYANRVSAQSVLGGPAEYKMCREDPTRIQAAVDKSPDLFSIIRHAVFVEHPELSNPHAPPNRFEVLDRVLAETLDREAPAWRQTQQPISSQSNTRPNASRSQRYPGRKIREAALAEALDREVPGWREMQRKSRVPNGPHDAGSGQHSTSEEGATQDASSTGLRSGLPVEVALSLFLRTCKEPGADTLFVTDRWITPRLQSLRALLSEPITSEQAEALRDALLKRAGLDEVIHWLSDSTLSWPLFLRRKQESDAALKKIKAEQEKLEYERKLAEAEMAWKTKAATPWEAAMRNRDLQAGYDPDAARQKYGQSSHPCPICGSQQLTWFYYFTPPPPYELRGTGAHGAAGWMTACEHCGVQVDFFQESRVYY